MKLRMMRIGMVPTVLLLTGCDEYDEKRFSDQMDKDDAECRACMFDPIETLPKKYFDDPWCQSFIKERPWDETYR